VELEETGRSRLRIGQSSPDPHLLGKGGEPRVAFCVEEKCTPDED